ncbi:MAG TPA: MFS transporter [Dehalococcoidia bacterium]|nr:MFS transporter [Dehalococcoidia bacterium]
MSEVAARDSTLAVNAPSTADILLEEEQQTGGTFRTLKYRDYRLLWISTLFASGAQWVQQVTVGWLVYEMTDSAFLLGAVNGFRALPLLFLAPLGGVLADRTDRKALMQWTQVMLLIASAVMTVIIFMDRLEVWHLFTFTLVTGVGWAFNNPVRQSVVPNLIPKPELMNALALQSAGFNVTRIIGPSLGGVMLDHLGGGENFALQTFFYVGVIGMVAPMMIPALPQRQAVVSVKQNLKEGIVYVWRSNRLRVQLALAFVPTILAFPYMALMPIFARDVLGYGPGGFGLMSTAVGVGAVVGTLTMATLTNVKHKGRIMLGAVFVLGVSLILFSQSKDMELSLVILAFTGAAQMVYLTTNQTILQLAIPDDIRGRVMGIYMLSQGMMPLGGLLGGALADFTSAPTAVLVMGSLVCAMAVLFFVQAKDLREA